ncbi:MAG: hypothetical protein LCH95_18790 [Proteobacteria bacterium]|nr:hypothetical protein [Pseudomonadota bacterium]
MPVQWTVSHPTRLIVAVARGDLGLADIEEYLDDIVAKNTLAYRKIFDLTNATARLDDDALMALGARIRAYRALGEIGPLAIVATTQESYEQAHIFAALAEAERPIQIFRDLHEARRWLDDQSGEPARKA